MSTALITRDDAALKVEFTESAVALKNQALEMAGLIARVTDASEQANAVEAQQAIAQTLSQVEKARKACKDPVLNFGRAIDDAAKDFVEEVKEEQLRLARLVGDFQQLQQAKAAAAEKARRLEEERIEREKQEAIIKAAREQADRQRVLDEATAAARRAEEQAKNEQQRLEAERRRIELEEAQAKSQAASHAEFDAIAARAAEQQKDLPPVTFAPARAEGQRVTSDWEVAVTDIHTLYRHHPNCVKLEPLMSEIKNLLKGGTTPKGVTAKAIVKAGVSAGRPRAAIEV
jgi:chromosome segregation ATPase